MVRKGSFPKGGGGGGSVTEKLNNIPQEYGVHILARSIVMEAEIENKKYQGPNIAALTSSTACNR